MPAELVRSPFFTTGAYRLTEPMTCDYADLDSFVILICTEGACRVACGEEEVRRHIVPVEEMLSDYPEFKTTDAFSDKMLANGNWLPREQVATSGGDASAVLKDGMQVRMYSSTGNFTAIYQYVAVKNSLKNIKMFV